MVEKWQDKVDAAWLPLNLEIRSQEQAYRQNGGARMFGSVNPVIPTALTILLGIVLAGGSGHIDRVADNMRRDAHRLKVSGVPQAITIDQNEELLIHLEYLQSSIRLGKKKHPVAVGLVLSLEQSGHRFVRIDLHSHHLKRHDGGVGHQRPVERGGRHFIATRVGAGAPATGQGRSINQAMFNDHFDGGQRTGLFGRGLDGFTDSVLKVFGV